MSKHDNGEHEKKGKQEVAFAGGDELFDGDLSDIEQITLPHDDTYKTTDASSLSSNISSPAMAAQTHKPKKIVREPPDAIKPDYQTKATAALKKATSDVDAHIGAIKTGTTVPESKGSGENTVFYNLAKRLVTAVSDLERANLISRNVTRDDKSGVIIDYIPNLEETGIRHPGKTLTAMYEHGADLFFEGDPPIYDICFKEDTSSILPAMADCRQNLADRESAAAKKIQAQQMKKGELGGTIQYAPGLNGGEEDRKAFQEDEEPEFFLPTSSVIEEGERASALPDEKKRHNVSRSAPENSGNSR